MVQELKFEIQSTPKQAYDKYGSEHIRKLTFCFFEEKNSKRFHCLIVSLNNIFVIDFVLWGRSFDLDEERGVDVWNGLFISLFPMLIHMLVKALATCKCAVGTKYECCGQFIGKFFGLLGKKLLFNLSTYCILIKISLNSILIFGTSQFVQKQGLFFVYVF